MATNSITSSRVLAALEMRARDSYADLAAFLDTSEQVVQYHMDKAERDKILLGYNAVLDIPCYGKSFHLLYLRFFGLGSREERQWIASVEGISGVALVARTIGRWNAIVAVIVDDREQLSEVAGKICSGIAGKVSELVITSEVECTYSSMQLIGKAKPVRWGTVRNAKPLPLDTLDRAILSTLAENCRTSASALARQFDTAPSTILRRIENLERARVILGYRAFIDFEKLGFHQYRLLLRLSNLTPTVIEALKKRVLDSGIAQSVSRYLGLADFDIRCYSRTIEELADFIGDLRDKFPDEITQVEIVPLFSWKRINYFPGD